MGSRTEIFFFDDSFRHHKTINVVGKFSQVAFVSPQFIDKFYRLKFTLHTFQQSQCSLNSWECYTNNGADTIMKNAYFVRT